MTDIERAAKQYSMENSAKDVSIKEAFEEGADYMIDKFIDWIDNHFQEDELNSDCDFSKPYIRSTFNTWYEMMIDLRKAMEE